MTIAAEVFRVWPGSIQIHHRAPPIMRCRGLPERAAPLRGRSLGGNLTTFAPEPVLTVVNFGKIIPDKPANRGRQGLAGRRSRADPYFVAIFEIDRWE